MLITGLYMCSRCLLRRPLQLRYFCTLFRKRRPLPLCFRSRRFQSSAGRPIPEEDSAKKRNFALWAVGGSTLFVAITFAAVPAYKVFCQKMGLGGDTRTMLRQVEDIQHMSVVKDRLVKVRFSADVNSNLAWNFKPLQDEILVHPGETALAFYSAMNPTNKPIVGIATYNVLPFDAALYFTKIQCFCFEEQILNPKEEVDLPVFFYIDPQYVDDPKLENVNDIVLNYTFFESHEGLQLTLPNFQSNGEGR